MEEIRKSRLRIEFEIVPSSRISLTETLIKHEFELLLRKLIDDKLINTEDFGASMIIVDITPVEWLLS